MIAAAQARGAGVTRLLGLDIDPLALAMAKATRDVRRIKKLELRHADFPARRSTSSGHRRSSCNPPYTRHQDIPANLKSVIHDGSRSRLGRSFSRLASLHVLFLLRALEVADDDARIAFLTPAHWLDMNYAREIKATVARARARRGSDQLPGEGPGLRPRRHDGGYHTHPQGRRPEPRRTRVVLLNSADSHRSRGCATRSTGILSAPNESSLRSDLRWGGPSTHA